MARMPSPRSPAPERLAAEGAGAHENGAISVVGLSVVVRELEASTELYSALFESGPHQADEIPDVGALGR